MSQTYRIGTLNFTGSQAILSASLEVSGSATLNSIVQGNADAPGLFSIARGQGSYAIGYGSYAAGYGTTQTGQIFVLAVDIVSGDIRIDSAYDGQDLSVAFPENALLYIYNDDGTYPISRSYFNVPQNRTIIQLYNRSVSILGSRDILVDHVNFNSTFIFESPRNGAYSHAMGENTETGGEYSFAQGQKLLALGSHQHIVGIANKMRPESHAFIIGAGTVDGIGDVTSRKNLLFASGSIVQITGSVDVSGSGRFMNGLTVTGSLQAQGVFSIDKNTNGSGSVMMPINNTDGFTLGFPSNPKEGSMFVDPNNSYLWVYVNNTWKYATLLTPA